MKNSQKGFINIIIAVVVVAAIAGYVAWDNNLIPKNIISGSTTNSKDEITITHEGESVTITDPNGLGRPSQNTPANSKSIQVPSSSDTSWNTYTDPSTLFTIKYPSKWHKEVASDGIKFSPSAESANIFQAGIITDARKITEHDLQVAQALKNLNYKKEDVDLGGQKGYVLRASQGSASTAQWFIEFGTPHQFVFYATVMSRDGSSTWLADASDAVKTVKFNMSKIESEIQAPKPFTISLLTTRAAAKSQVIISGKNGFHQTIENTVWYGFSSKARIELKGANYTKTIPKEGTQAGGDLSFRVPDDIIAGDYKITVFDFSDDTYRTPITSNTISLTIISVPCPEGQTFDGRSCAYKNYIYDDQGHLIPDCGVGKWWNGGSCVNN